METRKILDIRTSEAALETFRKDVEAVALYKLSLQEAGGYGPDARGRMVAGNTPRVTSSDIQTALRNAAVIAPGSFRDLPLSTLGASGADFRGFVLADIEAALSRAGFRSERLGSGLYFSL